MGKTRAQDKERQMDVDQYKSHKANKPEIDKLQLSTLRAVIKKFHNSESVCKELYIGKCFCKLHSFINSWYY